MTRRFAVIASCLFVLISANPAAAQFADVLNIVLPTSVLVGTPVPLHAESPSLALETSLIVWKLDGATVQTGVGASDYTTTFTDTREHQVTVSVTEPGGVTRVETTRIHASSLDILWEAETLVPPLYAGRALPSAESTVRIEALLGGDDASPSTHIYTWSLNGKRLAAYSGVAKSALRIALPPFQNSALVGVSVTSVSGTFTGQTSVKIETHDPQVLFYTKKPLIGIWTNTTLELTDAGTSDTAAFVAIPLFMSAISARDASLSYTWSLPPGSSQNNEDDTPPNEVIVPSNAPFSVRIIQTKTLLQEAYGVGRRRSQGTETADSVFGLDH